MDSVLQTFKRAQAESAPPAPPSPPAPSDDVLATFRAASASSSVPAPAPDVPDVRTQIANRVLNPPPTAHGDPRAKPESALESIFPAAAHPLSALGGALSAINPFPALAHPIDALSADMATRGQAVDRLRAEGSKLVTRDPADPKSGQDLRDMFTYAVPFFGPAMAHAGEQMESPDATTRARGFGGAVGLTSGPAIVKRAVVAAPDVLRASAENGYGKVFGPDANPAQVKAVVPRLIDEGVRTRNPNVDLTKRATSESANADATIDRAAASPDTPALDRNAVLSQIEDAKQQYLNRVMAPDEPYSSIKRANGKFAGGKWRQDANPNVTSAVPTGPQAESALADLNAQADTVRSNASRNGTIDPVAARKLQSANPDASTMNSALQSQLNANPDIASASGDRAHWDTVNELAADAPANRPLLPAHTGTRALAGAVAGKFVPSIGLGVEALNALPVVYRFMTSPAWRTTSALVKAHIADLIKSNDVAGAAEVVARVGELEPQAMPAHGSGRLKQNNP